MALHGPLSQAIVDAGGVAASLPFCQAMVGTLRNEFIASSVIGLATVLGLEVDESRLRDFLERGFDGTDPTKLVPPPQG